MKMIRTAIIIITVALIAIGSFSYIHKGNEVNGATLNIQENVTGVPVSQQNMLNDIKVSLEQQGVPIKSIKISSDDRWNPPVIVAYDLEISGIGDTAFCDAPLFSALTTRTIQTAQKNGLNIGATSQTWVNSEGKILSWAIKVSDDKRNAITEFDSPQILDNNAAASLIRNRLSLSSMTLDKLDVYLDRGGMRWANIELQVPDISAANASFTDFLNTIREITKLNAGEKVQIGVILIKVNTTKGEPILTYVTNLQLGSRTWWQAEGLSEDWFPHPVANIQ